MNNLINRYKGAYKDYQVERRTIFAGSRGKYLAGTQFFSVITEKYDNLHLKH